MVKNILLVDDDPFILDIYAKELKKSGYGIDIADNPTKALDKIQQAVPDVVILDLNLGEQSGPQDGIDLLRRIRQNPLAKDLKVIVMSNYSKEVYRELSNLPSLGVAKTFLKVEATPQEVIGAISQLTK